MSYWFFLSYASRDAKGNPWLDEFFDRLALAVGRAAALPSHVEQKEIGFYDKEGLEPGDEWPGAIAEALQSSRVLVCLFSKSYFKSVFCGKEFEVFRSRVAAYAPPPGSPRPRLIIPVLWDSRQRLSGNLPEEIADLHNTHADFGPAYATEGLARMMSLPRLEPDVATFIEDFADRIVREAESHDLPRLTNLPPLREVRSAFHAPPAPPAPPAEPPTAGDLPPSATLPNIYGPDAAWYVYLAGRKADYQGVRRRVDCYGDRDGYQWQPHLPPRDASIGTITPGVAGEQGLTPAVLPLSQDLVKHLRKAEADNTVTVVVVDPWSVKVGSYRQLMRDYDEYRFDNCGVVIVWNDADEETKARRAELKDELREVFARNLRAVDEVFRDSVQTEEELREVLGAVIGKVRERLRERGKPARPVPSSVETFPNINGATG
ncbi:MAG: TIR-like protein FxsC [Pyrinomonadaceae bacterium]